MEVVLYQFGILFCIVVSSVFFEKNGLIYSTIAATLWTGVMVFTSWLFILQSATVFVGFVIGGVILSSKNHKRIQRSARELLMIIVIILAGILWFYGNKSTTSIVIPEAQVNPQDFSSIARTVAKQYPAVPKIQTVPPFIGENLQQVKFPLVVHSKHPNQQAASDLRHCLNLLSNTAIASCAN